MLRNVLEDYLDSINERDFDYPMITLLQAMGFFDIHFTHGSTEIGKDFIAKKIVDGIEFQYAIQSKKGDISQSLWRNEIRGQLEEAIHSNLSHPQFNSQLPKKIIFATTGRISGGAKLTSQEFKEQVEATSNLDELIFWEKEQLVEFTESYGLSGIYRNTANGLKGFAQFYFVYSRAIDASLTEREIEEFSRLWMDNSLDVKKRIFRATVECELLSIKLIENGNIYEVICLYICLLRALVNVSFDHNSVFLSEIVNELVHEKIRPTSTAFLEQFRVLWKQHDQSLISVCLSRDPLPFLPYLIWCSRVLEISAIIYFLATDPTMRSDMKEFIVEFINAENGCGHTTSDRYSVAIVWSVLVLIAEGDDYAARKLITKGVNWLCDRVEFNYGIAGYEADENEESRIILGYPFDFINVEKNYSYFYATALQDLAAFINDKEFYSDIWNDLHACDIGYLYWQFPDSRSVTRIDTDECLSYPNIPFQEHMDEPFSSFIYAEHIKNEPTSFLISQRFGKNALLLLSLLLKDRYFPTMWNDFVTVS